MELLHLSIRGSRLRLLIYVWWFTYHSSISVWLNSLLSHHQFARVSHSAVQKALTSNVVISLTSSLNNNKERGSLCSCAALTALLACWISLLIRVLDWFTPPCFSLAHGTNRCFRSSTCSQRWTAQLRSLAIYPTPTDENEGIFPLQRIWTTLIWKLDSPVHSQADLNWEAVLASLYSLF